MWGLCLEALLRGEGIDYNDVLSLIVKHKSIRMLLAMVTKLNLEL